MRRFLKATILTVIATTSLLGPAVAVRAVDVTSKGCEGITNSAICTDANTGKTGNPLLGSDGVLTKAISLLSLATAIISVIVIVVAGIRFSVSQGDSQKVNVARNSIIYALVGIVVATVSQGIVIFVLKKL
jgi:hypothetical protein